MLGSVMGRRHPSWRTVVEQKTAELSRFRQFLRGEDRVIFDDLITQARLYASGGEIFASPVKEMSLLFSMIFAQHKKLTELERKVNEKASSVGSTAT
jgi:hypothetical protein